MNIENYTYLLANPQKITSVDLIDLDILIQKYPYFQSARALQLKGLKNQESYRYNDALKLAAAHTTDRDILFEYITSEKFIQNEISKSILQQDDSIRDIAVISEAVLDNLSIDTNWKVEKEKADAILNPDLFHRKVNSLTNLVTTATTNENNEKPENILATEKPLEFTKKDTHSFSEWLKLTKAQPIERTEENIKNSTDKEVSKETDKEEITPLSSLDEEKERKFELINKFIQERPKIIPTEISQKTEHNNPAKTYTQPADSLMTETLARVYLQQKNYKKAIQAYKILILKNPEKSGFFADQIRAIEKLINTEQQ